MKNILKSRNRIIIVLCITILFLSIGFMILSIKLKEEKDKKEVFNVEIDSIQKNSTVKGKTEEPIGNSKILDNKKEAEFNLTLNHARDEITYLITIKNKGTIKAQIVDILFSPDYLNKKNTSSIYPVDISFTDIIGQELEPNEEKQAKLVVSYNPSTKEDTKKNISFKIALLTKSK